MTTWFRTYFEDEDLWLYFEADDEGWATRQVATRGADAQPVTAASLEEVLHLRDNADRAAMGGCERQSGVLSEGNPDGRQDQPRAAEISAEEFERLWAGADKPLRLDRSWRSRTGSRRNLGSRGLT
ncbi:hypothetical protein [Embleya sp. NPDC005575]|uniref:hypothetical protein n=1 Tax=Embleya sp. NPDC005575 TaxID=3156892 RepID=UPI0033A9BAC4